MNKLRLSNLSELNLVIRVYNQTRCNFYNIIGTLLKSKRILKCKYLKKSYIVSCLQFTINIQSFFIHKIFNWIHSVTLSQQRQLKE